MLKARAAAGGATAITAVEAELAGRVAALFRQGGARKQLADRVPRAHITHGIGARRLADGRLVHKYHFAEQLGAQQARMGARRLGRLAKVAQQRGCQHILNQGGLARARHTGHTDQALQRNLDRHVLQVVLGHALQDQARGVGCHHALETHAHLLAAAQVGAGHGVRALQRFGGAVKHNLPALLARAGAHVNHAVCGQHHGRVMLHHHQRIARIAQALHGHDDAVHVPRVQADAGLVQHKQGIHQRSAQCRGQVDALHLPAAERAALPVQREVADADVTQVLEACADFFEQELQRFSFSLRLGRSNITRTRSGARGVGRGRLGNREASV